MRVLAHIKKLDDCFGQSLVRVICDCAAVREIEPESLARLVGWKITLKQLAPRMRCSSAGTVHRILGHASFSTTMKLYGGLTAEALESAAGTLAEALEPRSNKRQEAFDWSQRATVATDCR